MYTQYSILAFVLYSYSSIIKFLMSLYLKIIIKETYYY